MKSYSERVINYFSAEPNKLFLLDGVGAALTTCCLFFVLRPYYAYVGMPPHILSYLSAMGLAFFTYSMSCYFFLEERWKPFLRIVAVANFLYCMLTLGLLYANFNTLTKMGLAYFVGEILVILLLVYIELSVANRKKPIQQVQHY